MAVCANNANVCRCNAALLAQRQSDLGIQAHERIAGKGGAVQFVMASGVKRQQLGA